MTNPQRATPEQQAFALYLAGRSQGDIAAATQLDSGAVREVTEGKLGSRDLELARLDQLWARQYPKAVQGDVEATAVCMRITQLRLQIERDWRRRPPERPGTAVETLGGPDDIQRGWRILAGGTPGVAAALIEVALHGRSEVARVQASIAVLDRVGLNVRQDVTVRTVPAEFDMAGPTDDSASPSDVIRRRMQMLRDRTMSEGAEIVDAEIVPDEVTG